MDLLNQEKTDTERLSHSKEYVYKRKNISWKYYSWTIEEHCSVQLFSSKSLDTLYSLTIDFKHHGLCIHDENLLCLPDKIW